MSDQIKREQEIEALRQLIEQTYANNPAVLNALRANADTFGSELRQLPSGTSPAVAIDHLTTHQWFREAAESEVPESNRTSIEQRSEGTLYPGTTWPGSAAMQEEGRVRFDQRHDKQYVGEVSQPDPQINLLTPEWQLRRAADMLVRGIEGWVMTRDIGPRKGPGALYLVVQKVYAGHSERECVTLYLSAFDLGFHMHPRTGHFHLTGLDAYFIDSARTWNVLAAEQIVAEALEFLHHTFTLYSEPAMPLWHRVSGFWACGRVLYQCPDWTG